MWYLTWNFSRKFSWTGRSLGETTRGLNTKPLVSNQQHEGNSLSCVSNTDPHTVLCIYCPVYHMLTCVSYTVLCITYCPVYILSCVSHTVLCITHWPVYHILTCVSHTVLCITYCPVYHILSCVSHADLWITYWPCHLRQSQLAVTIKIKHL